MINDFSPFFSFQSTLRYAEWLIAFLLCFVSAQASALDKVDWIEDVQLRDGRIVEVKLSATNRIDASMPWPGYFDFRKSSLDTYRLEFRHPDTNERISWEGLRYFSPVILDFVGSVPFLVIRGRPNKETAQTYGCPELPFIYLSYTGFQWKPVSVETVPPEIVDANISIHSVWSGWEGAHFSTEKVARLIAEAEGQSGGVLPRKIPRTYGDWYASYEARFSRQFGDCRLAPKAPPPDAHFEAAIESSFAAQVSAQSVTASIARTVTASEPISASEYRAGMGEWTGSGYLSAACKEIVQWIYQIRKYEYDEQDGKRNLKGFTLVTLDKRRIPIPEKVKTFAAAGTQLQTVTCDAGTIYAIARSDRDSLIIHRFSYAGEVIDVTRVLLPEVGNVISGNGWGNLWGVNAARGRLTFDIASYSYTGTANQGGVVEGRQTYQLVLPSIRPMTH
ncbi:hypothetical protein [Rhodoferax sp. TH121]|uniref:hypothetical protein n=1 Tax=Rhodoferax sp. TH121 TaxID=2022803 RepID=UPI001C3DA3D4|nr:hypothetical protein [Rhodoferax sp. TH121]